MSKLEDAVDIKGQGYSLTLVQGHPDSIFTSFFSLETARLMKPNFMWSLHGMENESDYSTNGLCHMTKMAAMSIYGKKLKKSSSLVSNNRRPWKLVCSIGCSSSMLYIKCTVACTVMCCQDGRGWFPILLDDLSKCRTNSQRKSQIS